MKNEEGLARRPEGESQFATAQLYADIIDLPHYEPKHHPRMSMWNRAAQFAPFAALTGYDAAIQESGRLTDNWVGLSESGNEEMNRKMELIVSMLPEHPSVTIEYFVPDEHKAGGSYQSVTGAVKRIDDIERFIELTDGTKVVIGAIRDIKIIDSLD